MEQPNITTAQTNECAEIEGADRTGHDKAAQLNGKTKPAILENNEFCQKESAEMKIGYASVSKNEQHLELQTAVLEVAGTEKIYKDRISGAKAERSCPG